MMVIFPEYYTVLLYETVSSVQVRQGARDALPFSIAVMTLFHVFVLP